MATFNELRRRNQTLAKLISQETGVETAMVTNIIHYARQLTPPDHPEQIDEKVFVAQMGLRFGITSRFHVQLMFESRYFKKGSLKLMNLDDFVRVLCIFLSPLLDVKINYVFSVYDFKRSDFIDISEITALLRTSIVHTGEENDLSDNLTDLINLVLSVVDTNHDSLISLEEFRAFVKHDILCIQLFGNVLPNEQILTCFEDLMKTFSPHGIRERFADERSVCLSEPFISKKEHPFYPGVRLDFT